MTDPSGLFSVIGVASVVSIGATILSIALPVFAGAYSAAKAGVSPWQYFGSLFEYEVWEAAIFASGLGALSASVIWLLTRKLAEKAIAFIGAFMSIVSLINSANLASEMLTGGMPKEQIPRFLAITTLTIIITTLLSSKSGQIGKVETKAKAVIQSIKDTGRRPEGFVGGRRFGNHEGKLPTGGRNPITYKEYDVNIRVRGESRGAERLVIGSNGKTYITNEHYRTFHQSF